MKCWNCGHKSAFLHEDADGEFWIECFDCGEHTEVYELEKDAWEEWETKEGAEMSEEKSDFHKYCEGLDIDGFPLKETELMRKYAEAHGFEIGNEQYVCSRPLPCIRDEHGEIREQTIKRLLQKINEELDELKNEIFDYPSHWEKEAKRFLDEDISSKYIADEAADTITAITTLLEALGIDAEMRDEAQRRVNSRNKERGRL